jgi:eukaryotic-like serine/threonine-protein kinase
MGTLEAEAARIFLEAVEDHDRSQWPAFVGAAAAGDSALLDRVQTLLKAHDEHNPMLDPSQLLATADLPSPSERPGTMIGPYKLLEQIGEGGMGVVFMAEQTQPLRRRVALKLLKLGLETRQVVARFEAERQALALMDHPHIAKVFDAGVTESGRPYFVMELVRGVPITEYCDERRLSTRQRLELFVAVCQAVQHAHQKGVIHRDLKPSNVLVTQHDTVAMPKVIDFGIAKAVTGLLTERTLFTNFTQMLGTPLYMSPEQAEMNGLDVDTRSDVYALGVLLYELLTGTTPFESDTLKKAGLDEMRRMIREDEPPIPSRRLSTLSAKDCSTISERRGVDGRRLGQLVHGELDWIVMRTLEKDRNRRYESASTLAIDVQRFLSDEPVLACLPSAGYRLKKFARRNRVALATLGIVVGALLGGTGVSVWQANEAHLARQSMAQERDIARSQKKRARKAVDKMYTQVAEQWLSAQPGKDKLQLEFLRDALENYREFARESSTDPDDQFETALAHQRVGRILLLYLEQRKEAREDLQPAAAMLEKLSAQFPDEPAYIDELAYCLMLMGWCMDPASEVRGDELQRRSVKLWEQIVAAFPKKHSYRQRLAGGLSVLGDAIKFTDAIEADSFFQRAISILEDLPQADSREPKDLVILSDVYESRSRLLEAKGRLPETIECLRKAVEVIQPLAKNIHAASPYQQGLRAWDWFKVACAQQSLGRLLRKTGRCDEARISLQQAIRIHERLVADFPESVPYSANLQGDYGELGNVEHACGRTAEAEQAFRKALQLAEQGWLQNPRLGKNDLIIFLLTCPEPKFRDPARAAALAREWVAQEPKHSVPWKHLVLAIYRVGNYQQALDAIEQARHLGSLGSAGFVQAMTHWQLGNKERARQCYAEAVAWMEKIAPGDEAQGLERAEAAALLGIKETVPTSSEAPVPKQSNQ